MLQIKECVMTCEACPSQWEIKLTNGHMMYARYRWGHLSVSISDKPTDNIMEAVRGENILGVNIGGGFDGCMTTNELFETLESSKLFKCYPDECA